MKLLDKHNLKIKTDKEYNHILEHPFTIEMNGNTHEVFADVYIECDEDGDVLDFCITTLDDDGFYTDEQCEEIDELLTETLRPQ